MLDYISILPDEIIILIFSNLPISDLLSIRGISKRYKTLVTDKYLLNRRDIYNQKVKTFINLHLTLLLEYYDISNINIRNVSWFTIFEIFYYYPGIIPEFNLEINRILDNNIKLDRNIIYFNIDDDELVTNMLNYISSIELQDLKIDKRITRFIISHQCKLLSSNIVIDKNNNLCYKLNIKRQPNIMDPNHILNLGNFKYLDLIYKSNLYKNYILYKDNFLDEDYIFFSEEDFDLEEYELAYIEVCKYNIEMESLNIENFRNNIVTDVNTLEPIKEYLELNSNRDYKQLDLYINEIYEGVNFNLCSV